MGLLKGKMNAGIFLTKANCYLIKSGRCSLDLVSEMYISPSIRLSQSDLLYCPRLYSMMHGGESMKPLAITLHECGHAEVTSAGQRACICGKKRVETEIVPVSEIIPGNCRMCARQLTFEENTGGNRNITLKVRYKDN